MLVTRHPIDFAYTYQELGRLEFKALAWVKHGDVPQEGQTR